MQLLLLENVYITTHLLESGLCEVQTHSRLACHVPVQADEGQGELQWGGWEGDNHEILFSFVNSV